MSSSARTRRRRRRLGPAESLGKRLFKARLELIGELDHPSQAAAGRRQLKEVGLSSARDGYLAAHAEPSLRGGVADVLHGEVSAMNLDNFVVRTKRRLVEKYAQPLDAWEALGQDGAP